VTDLSAARISADIGRLASLLDEAASEAGAGAFIDLTTLDGRVEAVCRATLDLPPVEARRLASDLEALLHALTRADQAMRTRHEALRAATEGRMDPHTARARARAAYGDPSTPDQPVVDGSGETL